MGNKQSRGAGGPPPPAALLGGPPPAPMRGRGGGPGRGRGGGGMAQQQQIQLDAEEEKRKRMAFNDRYFFKLRHDEEYFLNQGIDHKNPLTEAAAFGDVETCDDLINNKGMDANIRNERQQTAMHLAAEGDQVELLQFLVHAGAMVDGSNMEGQTPLMVAINFKCQNALTYLLGSDANANVNAQDFDGNTCAHLALTSQHLPTIKLVLMARPDMHVIAPWSRITLLHLAVQLSDIGLVDALLKGRFFTLEIPRTFIMANMRAVEEQAMMMNAGNAADGGASLDTQFTPQQVASPPAPHAQRSSSSRKGTAPKRHGKNGRMTGAAGVGLSASSFARQTSSSSSLFESSTTPTRPRRKQQQQQPEDEEELFPERIFTCCTALCYSVLHLQAVENAFNKSLVQEVQNMAKEYVKVLEHSERRKKKREQRRKRREASRAGGSIHGTRQAFLMESMTTKPKQKEDEHHVDPHQTSHVVRQQGTGSSPAARSTSLVSADVWSHPSQQRAGGSGVTTPTPQATPAKPQGLPPTPPPTTSKPLSGQHLSSSAHNTSGWSLAMQRLSQNLHAPPSGGGGSRMHQQREVSTASVEMNDNDFFFGDVDGDDPLPGGGGGRNGDRLETPIHNNASFHTPEKQSMAGEHVCVQPVVSPSPLAATMETLTRNAAVVRFAANAVAHQQQAQPAASQTTAAASSEFHQCNDQPNVSKKKKKRKAFSTPRVFYNGYVGELGADDDRSDTNDENMQDEDTEPDDDDENFYGLFSSSSSSSSSAPSDIEEPSSSSDDEDEGVNVSMLTEEARRKHLSAQRKKKMLKVLKQKERQERREKSKFTASSSRKKKKNNKKIQKPPMTSAELHLRSYLERAPKDVQLAYRLGGTACVPGYYFRMSPPSHITQQRRRQLAIDEARHGELHPTINILDVVTTAGHSVLHRAANAVTTGAVRHTKNVQLVMNLRSYITLTDDLLL